MGGGFIHQEKVGRIKEEHDEGEAGFFPSAQDAHGFKDVISAEKE